MSIAPEGRNLIGVGHMCVCVNVLSRVATRQCRDR